MLPHRNRAKGAAALRADGVGHKANRHTSCINTVQSCAWHGTRLPAGDHLNSDSPPRKHGARRCPAGLGLAPSRPPQGFCQQQQRQWARCRSWRGCCSARARSRWTRSTRSSPLQQQQLHVATTTAGAAARSRLPAAAGPQSRLCRSGPQCLVSGFGKRHGRAPGLWDRPCQF